MLISLRSDGTAVMLLPSHVYQGSNVANVFVTAPFPNTTVLQVGFTLPNGTTASAPMTYVQDSENNLVVWQYTISSAITNEAGAASISITATTQTGQVIASQSVPFTIEETTLPVLPDTPSQDEWTLVLQYIQQNSANIATLQGQVSSIEETANTANENASTALSTAQSAQQTAAEAQTTADGLASSIEQANTNASAAVQTANQAASEVGQYTAQIAEANQNASEALNKATQAEQTVGTFETALNEANTNAENAVSTANAAQQTAEAAQTTANGLSAQIEAANTNASAAVSTAQGAETTAQQAETTVQAIVDGTTPAGNANQLGGVAAASYAQLVTQNVDTSQFSDLQGMYSYFYSKKSNSFRYFSAYGVQSGNTILNNILGYPPYTNNNSLRLAFEIMTNQEYGFIVKITCVNPFENDIYVRYLKGEFEISDYIGITPWQTQSNLLSIDPTKLTPSTANGWTEGTPSSALPAAGNYYVAIVVTPASSSPVTSSIGLLPYTGAIGAAFLSTGENIINCFATSSGFVFIDPATSEPIADTVSTVWYKQI